MIEVEKKIEIDPVFLDFLAQHASFISKKSIKDVYYDSVDYRYTTQNIWLREREGGFELKKGVKRLDRTIDRYEEMTDQKRILTVLRIDDLGNFASSISQARIFPFASFVT